MNADPLTESLRRARPAFVVLSLAIAVFLLLPLAIVVVTSVTRGEFLEFPPQGFSLKWYSRVAHDPEWTDPFKRSLLVGLEATLIATVIGTAAALAMRRLAERGAWLRTFFVAPIAMPIVAYGLGLWDLFDRTHWLEGSTLPVAIGQAVLAFPLVYVVVSAGLASIDPRITRAATSLGARWPTVVWRIELPLVKTSILAGLLFAFTLSFDEVVVALFLAPPDKITLPLQMFHAAKESISPELSAASTIVVTLVATVLALGGLAERRAAARRQRRALREAAG